MAATISIGFPRIHMEAGERRDFLPSFIAHLEKHGAQIVLEHTYGTGMGLSEDDYRAAAPGVRFAPLEETYQQEYVLVLRYPGDDKLALMKPGSCLISMLHYPTRPARVEYLRSLGIEAISLDSVKDDTGRRLVENLRSVAWNGVEVAFRVLRSIYPPPGLESPHRPPVRVTLLGAGAVGMHAMQAAIRYGDEAFWKRLAANGVPGIELTVVDYDLTNQQMSMMEIVRRTDLLIDATQRPEPISPVIPNEWIGLMVPYAVLLDLSVDPYECEMVPRTVKGIEGIPNGNLDQYIFPPTDPAYDRLPNCIDVRNRRYAVSCYSWPGIYPKQCMDLYGKQIAPLLRTILESGGLQNLDHQATFFHRAIGRALLSRYFS
jgi:alanine dehydrogenase